MKHHKLYLSGFIILLAMMACVIPGQTTQLAPTADPNIIATFIAGTAQASAQQTEQANLVVVPTPTTVPTEMPVQTAVVSAQGTSLETRTDGSALFTDHKAGIQVTFPVGWWALRTGEPEYYQAWEKEITKSPVFMNVFGAMQDSDPNEFRVTAIDIRSEQITEENFSKMEVVFSPDDKRPLDEVRVSMDQKLSNMKSYKLLSSRMAKTSDGLDIVIIEFQWESTTPENIIYTTYHKEAILAVPSGLIAIQLFTNVDQKDNMLVEFDKVVDSLVSLTL